MELVEFCNSLETDDEIFQTQGEVNHKKTRSPVNDTNPPSRQRAKVQTRLKTPRSMIQ